MRAAGAHTHTAASTVLDAHATKEGETTTHPEVCGRQGGSTSIAASRNICRPATLSLAISYALALAKNQSPQTSPRPNPNAPRFQEST